ncbi:MAG: hypothetical protein Q8R06_01285 [Polaromonas sp.]|uniref:hypothetical protein n=1 Tax=Polaromonas sp. TaxID=1869339 RepID=UPI0027357117|nr:hypothetical protein [Polaromonas sp.]MDP3795768.1 hypothetical protein [Polaromonas sp.]
MALVLDDDARRPKRELAALDSNLALLALDVSNLEQRWPFLLLGTVATRFGPINLNRPINNTEQGRQTRWMNLPLQQPRP